MLHELDKVLLAHCIADAHITLDTLYCIKVHFLKASSNFVFQNWLYMILKICIYVILKIYCFNYNWYIGIFGSITSILSSFCSCCIHFVWNYPISQYYCWPIRFGCKANSAFTGLQTSWWVLAHVSDFVIIRVVPRNPRACIPSFRNVA